MQTFIMRIHPVCREPASKHSFTRQRASPRTYVQFHSSRVQMRHGNDVDRVEVFSRSGGVKLGRPGDDLLKRVALIP
jgi:hypothetical protein